MLFRGIFMNDPDVHIKCYLEIAQGILEYFICANYILVWTSEK